MGHIRKVKNHYLITYFLRSILEAEQPVTKGPEYVSQSLCGSIPDSQCPKPGMGVLPPWVGAQMMLAVTISLAINFWRCVPATVVETGAICKETLCSASDSWALDCLGVLCPACLPLASCAFTTTSYQWPHLVPRGGLSQCVTPCQCPSQAGNSFDVSHRKKKLRPRGAKW